MRVVYRTLPFMILVCILPSTDCTVFLKISILGSGLWTKITFDSNIDNKFGASMLTKNDEFYFLGGVDDKNVCDRKIYNFKL